MSKGGAAVPGQTRMGSKLAVTGYPGSTLLDLQARAQEDTKTLLAGNWEVPGSVTSPGCESCSILWKCITNPAEDKKAPVLSSSSQTPQEQPSPLSCCCCNRLWLRKQLCHGGAHLSDKLTSTTGPTDAGVRAPTPVNGAVDCSLGALDVATALEAAADLDPDEILKEKKNPKGQGKAPT
ncbi:hypothetical protein TREES_T100021910 [Tupaia chinensis]|uniref:Uncharacterized protein n=1 Tax=Tupaia chinensis TaxID=246437 RepID=L9JEF1_TUPCH|nr:hypothetical protein TREES_T100021910 [Tupaia chinensis]